MKTNRRLVVIPAAAIAISLVVAFSASTFSSLPSENMVESSDEVFQVTSEQETVTPIEIELRHESSQLEPITSRVDINDPNDGIGLKEAFGISGSQNSVTITEWTLPAQPFSPTLQASNGDLWFAENSANKIARFSPSTSNLTEWTLPTAGSGPCLAVVDPTTNYVYFTERNVAKLARLNPSTNGLVEWFLPTNLPGFSPQTTQYCRIDIDSSGNIFTHHGCTNNCQFGHQLLVKVTPSTNTASIWNIGGGSNNLQDLDVATASGNTVVFFAENLNNAISRLITTGPSTNQVTRWPIPQPGSAPVGVAFEPTTGNVYFGQSAGNRVARLNPSTNEITQWIVPTASSNPAYVGLDSTGTAYFTEFNTNKVGRIVTPSNVITEWTIPGSNNGPSKLIVDSSDNVWFSEQNTNKIARLS